MRLPAGTALALLALLAAPARADEPAPPPPEAVEEGRLRFGSLSLYTENDKYLSSTDRNYTNGIKFTALSTDLRAFDAPEVPAPLRALSRLLAPLSPDDAVAKLGLSLGQNIYTPEDTQTYAYQPDDRPYAAWLYGAVAFQHYREPAGRPATLDTWEIQFGMVGPSALGEEVQNNFHHLIGVPAANGWDHQIHDEPGLNLVYERKWRFASPDARSGWGFDAIPHAGFSLGNIFTYANAGGSLRFGHNLPSDFGTNLIRPSGDSNPGRRKRFALFAFAAVDARAVARDITLDGNTFVDSPSIDKKPFVADLILGVGAGLRHLQLTYAQVVRTEEFKGQDGDQVFGSISLTYYY